MDAPVLFLQVVVVVTMVEQPVGVLLSIRGVEGVLLTLRDRLFKMTKERLQATAI